MDHAILAILADAADKKEQRVTGATFPPGRYGRRRASARGRRRWIGALLVGLVIIATAALGVRLYRTYGDPMYRPQVLRFTDITDTQVVVEFRVTVPPGGSAVCVVRARSRDGAEVGRAEVRVTAAPGAERAQTSYRLVTRGRPITGEVPRCHASE
jgi:hypothetical protein